MRTGNSSGAAAKIESIDLMRTFTATISRTAKENEQAKWQFLSRFCAIPEGWRQIACILATCISFVIAVWRAKTAESSARAHNEAQRCFIYRVAGRRRITR